MIPWLHIVGIGDDGLAGLSAAARALVEDAELLVGGDRHQAMVPETRAERLTWEGGLAAAMDAMEPWRGRRVVVLATGDPLYYGAGATLQRRFDPAEMRIIPVPGAFSLATAHLCWPASDVEMLTLHNRPVATLALVLAPGVRIIALSRNGTTPAQVARFLCERGWGPSALTVLEHLGGPAERRIDGTAETWAEEHCADLNTLAIECRAGPAARPLARVPGLPDDAFEHDGQITKREVRAATLAALAPLPGQVLWDVGAGCGSIAIEWLRSVPRHAVAGGGAARAIAVERDEGRSAVIARNAAALGVPDLQVVHGTAPEALAELEPRPDTVFVGGGLAAPGLLDACWQALPSAGRLVANAVTLDGEAALLRWHAEAGGELTRTAVSRAEAVGRVAAFRPLMPVTRYVGVKP